jgi:electron transfer flavoprotein beta subunit
VLAVGADAAVHLNEGFAGSDHSGIAKALAAAVKAQGCDVVFAGKLAIDDGAAQVPQMVAENLGWSCVTNITAFTHEGSAAVVSQPLGGGSSASLRAQYPAVFSCDKGLNDPRFPNIRGIVAARRKTIETPSTGDLELDGGVGADDASLSTEGLAYPAERPAGRIIDGDTAEAKAAELVRLLHNEAKVL